MTNPTRIYDWKVVGKTGVTLYFANWVSAMGYASLYYPACTWPLPHKDI